MATGPYQRQVNPATAQSLPGATAAQFGSAIGDSLIYAGGVVDRIQERAKARKSDEEAAAAGVDLATFSGEIERVSTDKRAEAAEGAAGHTDGLTVTIDDGINARLGKIKDPAVRKAYEARYAAMRGQILDREYAFERGKSIELQLLNIDRATTTEANNVTINPSPDALELALGNIDTIWDTTKGVDGNKRIQGKADDKRAVVVAYGNAMQTADPVLLVRMLDKGTLKEWLKPEDVETLKRGAQVEIRRAEAAQRQALAQAEANAREANSLLLKRAGDGDTSITDAEWSAAEARNRQFNLTGQAWDIGVARDKVLVNRETQDWTPQQYNAAIDELQVKGDKRTAGENVRLAHLTARRPAVVARFNGDWRGAAAAAGQPVSNIDWDNPNAADGAARLAQWRAFKRASGSTATGPLDNVEVAALRERANAGAAGKIAVVGALRRTFGRDGASAVRQLAPDDKTMPLLFGLPERSAQWYVRGGDALKAAPDMIDKDAAGEIWTEYAAAVPPDMREPMRQAASLIYAGHAGEHNLSEWDETRYRAAIHRAAGALGVVGDGASRTGGFVNWNAGKVWLPPTITPSDFARKISRAGPVDWINANSSADGTGPGGAPYYETANGRVRLGDAELARMRDYKIETTPVLGVYRLVGRTGGALVDKNGNPWHFRVDKLK